MPNIGSWELLVVALLLLVLFGAKRLPDSARSLGRSLRIFKAETKGLRGDNDTVIEPSGLSAADPVTPPAPPAGEQQRPPAP